MLRLERSFEARMAGPPLAESRGRFCWLLAIQEGIVICTLSLFTNLSRKAMLLKLPNPVNLQQDL